MVKKAKNNAKNISFFSNWIVRNCLLAIAFVVVLILVISVSLSLYTQHNKEISVPDFTNLSYDQAYDVASEIGIRVVIEDSLYIRRLKPGVVCSQNPKPGQKVKNGRRIFLTTNTLVPKQVAMPSLVGFSMRQARAELVRNGLALGRLIYVNDIATNNVLASQYIGKDIPVGTSINSGTKVDLVLGLSSFDNKTYVPNLIGRQYMRASDLIQDNSLNIGRVVFDSSVSTYADSVSAVVYQQRPSPGEQAVLMGSEVSIYLSLDPSKIQK